MSDPKPYNPDGASLDTGYKKLGEGEDCYDDPEDSIVALDITGSDSETFMPTKGR